MRVLIACEESQVVCIAFRERGHEAYSCDILPCSGGHPEWHIKNDVLQELDGGMIWFQNGDSKYIPYWDMMIFHDPCTYQCNSGVRWLYEKTGRMDLLKESCEFTKKLLNAPIEKIARENPIPHKYALKIIGRKYDQIIQPWMFGHGETKATCLWLKNLPKLQPINIVDGREGRIWKMPPSHERSKLRSRTYEGIGKAMAEQWG